MRGKEQRNGRGKWRMTGIKTVLIDGRPMEGEYLTQQKGHRMGCVREASERQTHMAPRKLEWL